VVQELASTFAPRVSPSALAAEAYDIDDHQEGVDRKTGQAADHGTYALNPLVWLTNKHGATIFAISLAAAIAALPKPGAEWTLGTAGTGGLILWPLFGATNQLLAGLAFLVITFYLWRRNVPVWFVAIPMLFMLIMPAWAMLAELPNWLNPLPLPDGSVPRPNWTVIVVAVATLALEAWMIIEAGLLWRRARGVLEETLPPLRSTPSAVMVGGRST